MMNRRTFLKLSAGALVLAAAGGLTGCGGSDIDPTSGVVKVGDVTFICDTPHVTGGRGVAQLTYSTTFTIQNHSAQTVTIEPADIICIFRDTDSSDASEETLKFRRKKLTVEPGQTSVYNGAPEFYLETDAKVPEDNGVGTYELRVTYAGNVLVFLYDGKKVTGSIEPKKN